MKEISAYLSLVLLTLFIIGEVVVSQNILSASLIVVAMDPIAATIA